ncbi:hypothetical protein TTHT_1090 [Thermotomaculum hydrothermale]|uniref:NolW-like domain-containing protein n=1 Tax=Thermotomaculum hydrothermale TaxID=981385 RepID=A0A7R6SZD7_9BACT|nr:secretin N-terminal domain-containing protein [Thermotomaculum hydrothermale]BBB32627.1 hypothetical protein TTHT_1090 [Thermotomaculum hydrothermale]
MIKRFLVFLLVLTTFLNGIYSFSEDKEIPARLQTEVIKLRHISFTKPIEETIKTIIDTDYSGNAFFTFDKKNNAIIVTATNVTIDKIKRFINKFDVKGIPVNLKIYILTESKEKGDIKKLPKSLVNKLEKINIYGAEILANAFITSKTGKSVMVSLKDPDYGTQFQITFFLTEDGNKIGLYDFTVYKITKEKVQAYYKDKPIPSQDVYKKWKIIQSSYSISPNDPLIIGISGDNNVDYIFAVTMIK